MSTFRLIRDSETDASHCLTLSMAQYAAIQFAECKPLTEIDEACLDALSAVITAELQQRTFNSGEDNGFITIRRQ